MTVHQAAIEAVTDLAVQWARQAKEWDARADKTEGVAAIAMFQRAQMLEDHARAIRDALANALKASTP